MIIYMPMKDMTTISLHTETRLNLGCIGTKNDTYDSLIKKLMHDSATLLITKPELSSFRQN